MTTVPKPIPFGCVLWPRDGGRRIEASVVSHASEPLKRHHLRWVIWCRVPVLEKWYRSTHQDTGVAMEKERVL